MNIDIADDEKVNLLDPKLSSQWEPEKDDYNADKAIDNNKWTFTQTG